MIVQCVIILSITGFTSQGMAGSHSSPDDSGYGDVRAKLIVSTILEPPFMMLKQNGVFLTGNDRFEGFLADVLRTLSRTVGFSYELRLVRDGHYGTEGENGTWNGMIGEVYKGHAHLAVGPIVVTDNRRKVVEFTDPILTFQTCALINKPRVIHARRKPRSNYRIKTLQDLYESDYQYGVISGSRTEHAFKTSDDVILKAMWSKMASSWPSTIVHSVQEGQQRAERDHYAFILHSPMAEYIAARRPCEFYITDEFLQEEHYAFVLRHSHSLRLRQSLNEGIKKMRNSGKTREIYDKWWKSECDRRRDISQVAVNTPPNDAVPWKYVTVAGGYSNGGKRTTIGAHSIMIALICVLTLFQYLT